MNKHILTLLKAILAGISIGLGGLAYLSIDNKIIGSIFFTLGLFIIVNFDLNLFTGKICYVVEKKNYATAALILLGNLIGSCILGLIINLTRLSNLITKAESIVAIKHNDSLLSLFILAILCNALIYLAVEGFKNFEGINKILALFFGVSVFVLVGFEHSIADMFYFSLTLSFNLKTLLCMIIVILGNIVGGISSRYLLTAGSKK